MVEYVLKGPIPDNMARLEKWDKPCAVSELTAFLGFANYYPELVRLRAHHAAPFYSTLQLSKSKARQDAHHLLHSTSELDTAFEDVKTEMVQPPAPIFITPHKHLVHQHRRQQLRHGPYCGVN